MTNIKRIKYDKDSDGNLISRGILEGNGKSLAVSIRVSDKHYVRILDKFTNAVLDSTEAPSNKQALLMARRMLEKQGVVFEKEERTKDVALIAPKVNNPENELIVLRHPEHGLVVIDSDLADYYSIPTREITRNMSNNPELFSAQKYTFSLKKQELANLRWVEPTSSQVIRTHLDQVIRKRNSDDEVTLFSEAGCLAMATRLRSPRAIQNIQRLISRFQELRNFVSKIKPLLPAELLSEADGITKIEPFGQNGGGHVFHIAKIETLSFTNSNNSVNTVNSVNTINNYTNIIQDVSKLKSTIPSGKEFEELRDRLGSIEEAIKSGKSTDTVKAMAKNLAEYVGVDTKVYKFIGSVMDVVKLFI